MNEKKASPDARPEAGSEKVQRGTRGVGQPLVTGLQTTAPMPPPTGIQTRSPGDGPIPLPPLPTPSVALPGGRALTLFCRSLDVLQLLLVLLFAFLFASFA